MIQDIDNALREMLLKEMPRRRGEVDIVFDQPRREWSSRLSKPCLNLYLYDIRENTDLRGSEQPLRQSIPGEDDKNPKSNKILPRYKMRHTPVRMDLCYLITGWAKEVQDEHRLLSVALNTFLRTPNIPPALLPDELKSPMLPVRLSVAQGKVTSEITDIWSTMDNELKPGLRLTVTIALEPVEPEIVSPVITAEVDVVQTVTTDALAAAAALGEEPPAPVLDRKFYIISGKITSQKYSAAVLKVVLVEKGKEIALKVVDDGGLFTISPLQEGEYHLDVIVNDRPIKRQKIQVPSDYYDFEV